MSDRPSFEQQNLAEQVYQIMVAQGSFYAVDAPIRQTLTNLAEFFAVSRKMNTQEVAQEIDAALRESDKFVREENGDDITYVTSRAGAYQPRQEDRKHMFRKRLYEPEQPLPVDDISVVVTTTRPALTTIEPVFISDYWQQQAGLVPVRPMIGEPMLPVAEPLELPEVVVVAPVPVSEPVPVVVLEPEPLPLNTVITLPNGLQIDLRRSTEELLAHHGTTLVAQLRTAIESDALRRVVVFGNQAFPESEARSFGKNDLRRISDYLIETGTPLLDTQIISDVFYHNPRQNDYESFRFALNYRLSREKDFEFVGVEGARQWTTKRMPMIGTKRVKASEMGQLTGYLEEGFDDSLADQSVESIRQNGSMTHILTFFEWEYGILPFSRALSALLPGALLAEQRAAVLRFELPQQYTSSLIELRYPTGNRGGWLQGLEALFHDYLVPGALVTLARTEEPHVFRLSYEEQPRTEDRLLVLDESKKTPKFVFANVAFECLVDTDMLVNQQQFGRLRNLKAYPMNERRKGELMLEDIFETLGDPVGTRAEPRYALQMDRLFVALNVLRPASREFLTHLLDEGELFAADEARPGFWAYSPVPQEDDQDEDEGEDEDFDDDE